jgi:hemolysin III
MYYGERFNSISHLLGVVFAVAATSILVTMASLQGDLWKVIGMSVYGSMLIVLFFASTLYHSIRGSKKPLLRQIDHVSIYLNIAGTYTPFMLVMRDSFSLLLLGVVWILALIGILQELLIGPKTRMYSFLIYFLMGSLAFFDTQSLVQKISTTGFRWLVIGGILYTVGVFFYAMSKRIKHGHGIWHLLVLGGAGCHFAALVGYVI